MTASSRLVPVLVLAALLASCNSDSSISPAAPSQTGGATRGATITGQVRGMSTAAEPPTTVRTLAATRLNVSILGTNISTMVDGSGNFELTGVPPGDVRLRFSGSGVDTTISLSGISATDHITITVTLNGGSARLDNENRGRDDDDDEDEDDNEGDRDGDELKGAIANLTKSCPVLNFDIRGTKVRTDAATKFDHVSCASVANGTRVEIKGRRQSDGVILATKVELDD